MTKSIYNIKNFRLFFLSEIFYCFAIGMGTIGANWVLIDTTGSAQLVGLLLTVNVLAGLFASPIIGILTDRFNRKSLLLTIYIVQSSLLIFLALFMYINTVHILSIFLFSIINGLGWTTYMATSRSLMQEILESKQYIKGNAIVEISLQVGMFTAGAISGVLYEIVGFEMLVLLNALVILMSSRFLTRIQYRSIIEKNPSTSFFQDFKMGTSYLKKEYGLFIFGVASILPSVSTMLFNVVLPSYVTDILSGNSIVFGLSDMFYGIGGLFAGLFASLLVRNSSYNTVIKTTFLLVIVLLSSLVMNEHVSILFVACLIYGFGNSALRIWMNTRIMEYVPKVYLGRIISVWTAISLFIQAILSISLGKFIDQSSANFGFIWLAIVMVVGLIFAMSSNGDNAFKAAYMPKKS